MPLLVQGQAVLEGFVHDRLHPRVDRRIDDDSTLEQVLDSEATLAIPGELVEDVLDRRRRVGLNRVEGRDQDRFTLAPRELKLASPSLRLKPMLTSSGP